jgi:hypothetical protein
MEIKWSIYESKKNEKRKGKKKEEKKYPSITESPVHTKQDILLH